MSANCLQLIYWAVIKLPDFKAAIRVGIADTPVCGLVAPALFSVGGADILVCVLVAQALLPVSVHRAYPFDRLRTSGATQAGMPELPTE